MQLFAHLASVVSSHGGRVSGSSWDGDRWPGGGLLTLLVDDADRGAEHVPQSHRPGDLAEVPLAEPGLAVRLAIDPGGETLLVVDVGHLAPDALMGAIRATAEAAASRRIRKIVCVGTRLSSTASGSSISWTAVSGADRASGKWSSSQVDSLPLGPITRTVVASKSDGCRALTCSRAMPSASSCSRSSWERCVRQPVSSMCCMLRLPF